MAKIAFIQYVRPDGARRLMQIDRPDNIAKAADLITSFGFRFAAEMLADNHTVSLTIEDDDQDYAIALVLNNPGSVGVAVDALISNFDLALAIKIRNERAN